MSIVTWIALGLVVGVLAKFLMPGSDPGGLILTVLIGIAGALLGGLIGTEMGLGRVTGFNLPSVALSTGGAVLLLFAWRMLKGR
jgi:uncharacterized membrane protein YeaQ/YmgE (transglycosylase-associated protein family)